MSDKANAPANAPPSISPLSRGSILQRQCQSCGQHKPTAEECPECKKKPLQRKAVNAEDDGSVPLTRDQELQLQPDPSDFSQIPVRSGSGANIQPKLQIGNPGDRSEQEADRVANQVMAAPARPIGISAALNQPMNPPPRIQRYAEQTTEEADTAPASVNRVLAASGSPLNSVLQQDMERRFNCDFSQVRVHTGAAAAQSAQDVNARAYTVGRNVVFGSGQFSPETNQGRWLIAHELAHVLQQLGPDGIQANQSSALSASTVRLQRSCVSSPCPAAPVPIDALFPRHEAAEKCIQTLYERTHPAKPGISLSYNADWLHLTGGRLQEKKALDCLRGVDTPKAGPNFTAKSGMFAGQPDIWDFLNQTMYEITTPSGAAFRIGKLGAEIALANQICGSADCGGLTFDRGTWAPPPGCYALGGDLYFTAANDQGVIIYTMLKDTTKELVTALLLALMANALKNAGPKAGAAVVQGGKAVGGKLVPVYAIASLIVAAGLLASGRAEAKPGPGEEPLVTLFKVLEQKGTPVPPEIQQMLDANPDLKEKLNKAMAEGGDPTKAQEEINKQILDTIAANKDQFTPEELELLLASTHAVGKALPKGDMTAEELKKLAAAAKAGKTGGSGSTASGSGADKAAGKSKDTGASETPKQPTDSTTAPAGSASTGKPASSPDPQALKYKDLNEENKKKISDAPQPVSRLFREFVAGQKADVKLNDAAAAKFFAIVPQDLTDQQAEALIGRLASSQGKTIDAVLESLKQGVEEVKKGNQSANSTTATATATTTPANQQNQPAKTPEQEIAELREKAKTADFKDVPEGKYTIKGIGEKITGNQISAYVYIKLNGVGIVGYIKGTVPTLDFNKLKAGDSFTITITYQSPLVDKEGKVYPRKLEESVTIQK